MTYNDAFIKLQTLVALLEEGDIPLDDLSVKVKEANELVSICENKLRTFQTEVEDATAEKSSTQKGQIK
jgi:exodeoxyribonuclease VII small subunit